MDKGAQFVTTAEAFTSRAHRLVVRILWFVVRLMLALSSVAVVLVGIGFMVGARWALDFTGETPEVAILADYVTEYRQGAAMAIGTAVVGVWLAAWRKRKIIVVLEIILFLLALLAAVVGYVNPDQTTIP